MNNTRYVILVLALVFTLPLSVRAEVNVNIEFSLPAPVVFEAPPEVIVLPDTNAVYVVPDIEFDLFFWNGWWWRPWEGRWYRSRQYNRGWEYYTKVPTFYYDVDPGWRDYYREQNWSGHRWNYERIPNQRLRSKWKQWHSSQYWQSKRTWGVESYQPRPRKQIEEIRYQQQKQYLQRPEVILYQQQIRELQRKTQPQRQHQARTPRQRSQPHENRQQVQEQKKQKHQANKTKRREPPKEAGQGQNRQHQGKSDQQHGKDKKHHK